MPARPRLPVYSEKSEVVTLLLKQPPSANRWWRNVRGRIVTSKAAREYKQYAANEALLQRARCIKAPRTVAVDIVWHRARKSGDLDKRIGVLLDALQTVAYDNDAQIVQLLAFRLDESLTLPPGTVQVTVIPSPLLHPSSGGRADA